MARIVCASLCAGATSAVDRVGAGAVKSKVRRHDVTMRCDTNDRHDGALSII